MSERDIEIPELFKFLDEVKPTSLLDVGCHQSGKYAEEIWLRYDGIKTYHGIDILPPGNEANFLDLRLTENFLNWRSPLTYDMVISISAIEHSGITTYKSSLSPDKERFRMVEKIYQLADKAFFITFPFGNYSHDGEFEAVSEHELECYETITHSYDSSLYYCELPSNPVCEWKKIDPIADRNLIKYDPSKGVQCVCILKGIHNKNEK